MIYDVFCDHVDHCWRLFRWVLASQPQHHRSKRYRDKKKIDANRGVSCGIASGYNVDGKGLRKRCVKNAFCRYGIREKWS